MPLPSINYSGNFNNSANLSRPKAATGQGQTSTPANNGLGGGLGTKKISSTDGNVPVRTNNSAPTASGTIRKPPSNIGGPHATENRIGGTGAPDMTAHQESSFPADAGPTGAAPKPTKPDTSDEADFVYGPPGTEPFPARAVLNDRPSFFWPATDNVKRYAICLFDLTSFEKVLDVECDAPSCVFPATAKSLARGQALSLECG